MAKSLGSEGLSKIIGLYGLLLILTQICNGESQCLILNLRFFHRASVMRRLCCQVGIFFVVDPITLGDASNSLCIGWTTVV